MRATHRLLILLMVGTAGPHAFALDLSLSGFATLGYARSDLPYTYQRYVDERGTFKRDSVAGLQLDARVGRGFGATVQVKAAPASNNDGQYAANVAWAFLSYRPTNDWLFRAGKQRVPIFLFSETYDVGATYDFARLPTEMYSLAPTNDFTGFGFSKNWMVAGGDLTLDGYWGEARHEYRSWLRDTIPGVQNSGAIFPELSFQGGGLVATYKRNDDTFRVGLHRIEVRQTNGQPLIANYLFVPVTGTLGYYQVSPALPGPGIPALDSVTNTTLSLGADVGLPGGLRVIGEFARSLVPHSIVAPQGNRGYASLMRRTGAWTPYLTYAFLRSPSSTLDLYNAVNANHLPDIPAIPNAVLINSLQRAGADNIAAFDQHSWALGASYSFSTTSKLKAEYLRTHIGDVSNLVDGPPGSTVRNQEIKVLSISYSAVF